MSLNFDAISSQDLARGAVLLGTGGGGDPYVGELFLRKQLSQGLQPRLIQADELADDAFVVCIAGVGAPTVLLEHLVSETILKGLLAEAERIHGRVIDAIICAEIGGVNAMFPLAVGAISGLPIVDGDGIGRAFPHIEMTTFSIDGCQAAPAIFIDDLGNKVSIDIPDNRTAETVVRAVTGALNGSVYGVLYPMSGVQVKRSAIRGTVTQALEIGRFIRLARKRSGNPVAELVGFLDGLDVDRSAQALFTGKIVDVSHETRDGYHWGKVVIQSLSDSQDIMELNIQNEFLLARHNGRLVAVVPDLLCLLDSESAEPLTAENLRYGLRVTVLAYSAPPKLVSTQSLAVVGPAQFGLQETWRPFTELVNEKLTPCT